MDAAFPRDPLDAKENGIPCSKHETLADRERARNDIKNREMLMTSGLVSASGLLHRDERARERERESGGRRGHRGVSPCA